MILSRSFPLRALLIALLPLALSAACDKLPRNGALDGQWQLVRRNDADVTAQRIYWAVQLDLIQLRSPRVAPTTPVPYSGGVILRFVRRADSLLVETGFLMDRDHGRDLHIGPRHPADLSALGVDTLPAHFAIRHLSSSRLVLTRGNQALEFRKW